MLQSIVRIYAVYNQMLLPLLLGKVEKRYTLVCIYINLVIYNQIIKEGIRGGYRRRVHLPICFRRRIPRSFTFGQLESVDCAVCTVCAISVQTETFYFPQIEEIRPFLYSVRFSLHFSMFVLQYFMKRVNSIQHILVK